MTLEFSGRRTQQHANSPGDFWSVLRELLSTAARWAKEGNASLDVMFSRKAELAKDMKTSSHDLEIEGSQCQG